MQNIVNGSIISICVFIKVFQLPSRHLKIPSDFQRSLKYLQRTKLMAQIMADRRYAILLDCFKALASSVELAVGCDTWPTTGCVSADPNI